MRSYRKIMKKTDLHRRFYLSLVHEDRPKKDQQCTMERLYGSKTGIIKLGWLVVTLYINGENKYISILFTSISKLLSDTHVYFQVYSHISSLHEIHTHTHNHSMALWILSGTTQVRWYQKKHSPTHTYHGHQSSLICFLHLLRTTASSLFNLRAWQSFSTISLHVFCGLPLGLAPSTSYSIHFFTQSLYSFCSTCPYHHNLFWCSTEIMSS